jgi:hypothetical protein
MRRSVELIRPSQATKTFAEAHCVVKIGSLQNIQLRDAGKIKITSFTIINQIIQHPNIMEELKMDINRIQKVKIYLDNILTALTL